MSRMNGKKTLYLNVYHNLLFPLFLGLCSLGAVKSCFSAPKRTNLVFFFFLCAASLWCLTAKYFFRPPPKKIRPPIFLFGPHIFFRPFATNHAARHMGSSPRSSTHRDGALPLANTCYFGPRARFINTVFICVCVPRLTTYSLRIS